MVSFDGWLDYTCSAETERVSPVSPVSVFKDSQPGAVSVSEISGAQLNRMLALAMRVERASSSALGVVNDVVRAEAAKLAAKGVFGF